MAVTPQNQDARHDYTSMDVLHETRDHLRLTMLTLADASTKNRSRLMGSTVKMIDLIEYLEDRLISAEDGKGEYHGVIAQVIDQSTKFYDESVDIARLIVTLGSQVDGEIGERIVAAAQQIINRAEEITGKEDDDESFTDDGTSIVTMGAKDR